MAHAIQHNASATGKDQRMEPEDLENYGKPYVKKNRRMTKLICEYRQLWSDWPPEEEVMMGSDDSPGHFRSSEYWQLGEDEQTTTTGRIEVSTAEAQYSDPIKSVAPVRAEKT